MMEATEGQLDDVNSRGFVKLHRELLESAVFQDPHLLQLFVYLLLQAQYKPSHVALKVGETGTRIVSLQAGQLITGRSKDAQRLQWAPSTFRARLDRLQAMGMVSIQPDSQFSIVSITNWRFYQSIQTPRMTGEGQPDDSRTTGEGQPDDTYKRAKKVKKAKEGKEGGEGAHAPANELLTLDDAKQFGQEIGLDVSEVENFWNHHKARGWILSKGRPCRDRRAAMRTWKSLVPVFTPSSQSGTALSTVLRTGSPVMGETKGEQNARLVFNRDRGTNAS